MTGFASITTAVEAIKLGACRYLAKPSSVDDIEAAFMRREGDSSVVLSQRQSSIKTLEWERIHETLAEVNFNISEAARRLGIAQANPRSEARQAACRLIDLPTKAVDKGIRNAAFDRLDETRGNAVRCSRHEAPNSGWRAKF